MISPNFKSVRSDDGTMITVSWQPITLEQARGFFVIRVTLMEFNQKRQGPLTMDVPDNETNTTFSGLDPGLSYGVTAGVINKNNPDLKGPMPSPTIVPPPPPCMYLPIECVCIYFALYVTLQLLWDQQ